MPSFGAETVDSFKYDFTTWGIDVKGEITEPSEKAIAKFVADIGRIFEPQMASNTEADDSPKTPFEAFRRMVDVNRLAEDDKTWSELAAAVSDLCGSHPSTAQINKLPARPKRTFLGMVVGTYLNPKVTMLGTQA